MWQGRAEVLQAELERAREQHALPAGEVGEAPTQGHTPAPRPWWQWWRRH
jgi:hypothetical protein